MNTATDLLSAVTDLWELTAPEKNLIKAAEHDSEANLHKKNGQRSLIRAEVLRDLCTGAKIGRDGEHGRVVRSLTVLASPWSALHRNRERIQAATFGRRRGGIRRRF